MEICKSDVKEIIRYLTDAEAFYSTHATTFREKDRPRLIKKLIRKLHKKNNHETK